MTAILPHKYKATCGYSTKFGKTLYQSSRTCHILELSGRPVQLTVPSMFMNEARATYLLKRTDIPAVSIAQDQGDCVRTQPSISIRRSYDVVQNCVASCA